MHAIHMSRSARSLALLHLLGTVALVPCTATAQPAPKPTTPAPANLAKNEDKVAAELERARVAYEATMNRVRKGIDTALAKKLADAQRGKSPDAERIAAVSAEQAAFIARGEWPDVPNIVALRNDAARVAKHLQDAHAKAMSGYTSAKNDEMVKAIKAELDQFASQSDIVPWSENLIASATTEARTLQAGDKANTLSVNLATDTRIANASDSETAEYRIEIRGWRKPPAVPGDTREAETLASLVIDLPLAASDGNKRTRVALPAQADKEGEYLVMLTVRKEFVGCDLGVARPVALTGAVEDTSPEPMQLILRAEGGPGAIEIEYVVVKPVVAGKPEVEQKVEVVRRERQPREIDRAENQDQLKARMDLSGTYRIDGRSGERPLEGWIELITDKRVTVVTKRDGEAGHIAWTFTRDGNALTLVEQEARNGEYKYEVISGSGEIVGKTIKWRNKGARWKGNVRTDVGSGSSELTALP